MFTAIRFTNHQLYPSQEKKCYPDCRHAAQEATRVVEYITKAKYEDVAKVLPFMDMNSTALHVFVTCSGRYGKRVRSGKIGQCNWDDTEYVGVPLSRMCIGTLKRVATAVMLESLYRRFDVRSSKIF